MNSSFSLKSWYQFYLQRKHCLLRPEGPDTNRAGRPKTLQDRDSPVRQNDWNIILFYKSFSINAALYNFCYVQDNLYNSGWPPPTSTILLHRFSELHEYNIKISMSSYLTLPWISLRIILVCQYILILHFLGRSKSTRFVWGQIERCQF